MANLDPASKIFAVVFIILTKCHFECLYVGKQMRQDYHGAKFKYFMKCMLGHSQNIVEHTF